MNDVILAILGGGTGAAIVSGLFALLNRRMDRKSSTSKALRSLMYDRIKHLGRKHIEDGYITYEDLEDLIAMHRIYHDDLHGNGYLDKIMNDVKNLEVKA